MTTSVVGAAMMGLLFYALPIKAGKRPAAGTHFSKGLKVKTVKAVKEMVTRLQESTPQYVHVSWASDLKQLHTARSMLATFTQ